MGDHKGDSWGGGHVPLLFKVEGRKMFRLRYFLGEQILIMF